MACQVPKTKAPGTFPCAVRLVLRKPLLKPWLVNFHSYGTLQAIMNMFKFESALILHESDGAPPDNP